jgi:hypothetical protein
LWLPRTYNSYAVIVNVRLVVELLFDFGVAFSVGSLEVLVTPSSFSVTKNHTLSHWGGGWSCLLLEEPLLRVVVIWRKNRNCFVVVWTPDDGQSLGPKEMSLPNKKRDPRSL